MIRAVPELANSVEYPRDKMLDRFGPFFFTSTISWMFALALMQPDIEEIGIWGVDMMGYREYENQRAGCHYFIMCAQSMGVHITVPPESDLLRPPPLYGYITDSPRGIKWEARQSELVNDIAVAREESEAALRKLYHLEGALDDHEHHMRMEPGE